MLSEELDSGQEQKVMEFDFPLPAKKLGSTTNFTKKHNELAEFLKITKNKQLYHIFTTVAGLCDPFTQPEEVNIVLSIDCLADLLISISYSNLKHMPLPEQVNIYDIDDDENDEHDDDFDVVYEYNRLETFDMQFSEKDLKILKEPDINSIKFNLSTFFFIILQKIQNIALDAGLELDLRFVENDETRWMENLYQWNPNPEIAEDHYKLRLCYSISCVLLVAIYKLFKPASGSYNLALNPYLHSFIKIWKCHSNIIILGLEIDRRLENENEENGTFLQTPHIVKETLRGSSSIRTVLAWILNQNPSLLYLTDESPIFGHDIKNESLLDFTHPLIRKNRSGGALLIDMRFVIVALLIVNSGLAFAAGSTSKKDAHEKSDEELDRWKNQRTLIAEIGDLLIDLEYDDKFDEDIRYIFGYEYFDSDDDDNDDDDNDIHENNDHDNSDGEPTEVSKLKEVDQSEEKNPIPTAIRSQSDLNSIDFDEEGRDWRDLPRGDNIYDADWFKDLLKHHNQLSKEDQSVSDDFFSSWSELLATFEYLKEDDIDGTEAETKLGQVVINTVAKAIRDEDQTGAKPKDDSIDPDRIYKYWTSAASKEDIEIAQEKKMLVPFFTITNFELLLINNQKLARCLIDQMLMCKGYRRVLIWFLTHNINLSTVLIDYVFELLTGLRGQSKRQTPYKFTRKGENVHLSEVERLMLLHEFLTNCSVFLSATEGVEIEPGVEFVLAESIAKKMMQVLCMMIERLISLDIISFIKGKEDDLHDYFNELQVLLINWVGKLPEARKLFFQIKDESFKAKKEEDPQENKETIRNENIIENHEDEMLFLQNYINSSNDGEQKQVFDETRLSEVFEKYSRRLGIHLKLLIALQRKDFTVYKKFKSLGLEIMFKDFKFFLENFNSLCEMEDLAESLFYVFEKIVATGKLNDLEEEQEEPGLSGPPELVTGDAISSNEPESGEAEFNDQFLNGEGDFRENKETEKKSKKKKKKKSKKGK